MAYARVRAHNTWEAAPGLRRQKSPVTLATARTRCAARSVLNLPCLQSEHCRRGNSEPTLRRHPRCRRTISQAGARSRSFHGKRAPVSLAANCNILGQDVTPRPRFAQDCRPLLARQEARGDARHQGHPREGLVLTAYVRPGFSGACPLAGCSPPRSHTNHPVATASRPPLKTQRLAMPNPALLKPQTARTLRRAGGPATRRRPRAVTRGHDEQARSRAGVLPAGRSARDDRCR
jgi:hypothetical protein